MTDIVIPAELRPVDGRFGCGPSKVRPEQLTALAASGATYLGTSHRQAPIRSLVQRAREFFGDRLDDVLYLVQKDRQDLRGWQEPAHVRAAVRRAVREEGIVRAGIAMNE